MRDVFICDYVRTAIGRFAGTLSSIRADDLAAFPLKTLAERNAHMDFEAVDDIILGCANQAGEDNRNIARMASLLAGLPVGVSATTLNRLCGSGMDAVLMAARAIKAGEADLILAGGVEHMSRAPFVMPKAESAFSRSAHIYDTTLGWRFMNPLMERDYGGDSMAETGDNVASHYHISRQDQDAFALRSQQKAAIAQKSGRLAVEIVAIPIIGKKSETILFDQDEHLRQTSMESLNRLKTIYQKEGATVTAGNASGINDGAAALIIASEKAVKSHGLTPIARIMGGACAGVLPRLMGVGPVPAIRKLCQRLTIKVEDFDIIELNEAFASQALAVLRILGFDTVEDHMNPNGGAIALGHPLGMSGARITGTAALELAQSGKNFALAAMCVGVGQGIAVALERA